MGAAGMGPVALLAVLVACSDAPRPLPPERESARADTPVRRTVRSAPVPERPVIEAGDLGREGPSAVGSERVAAEMGALPPELIAILHQGPGGPVMDGDDIALEFEPGGGMADAAIGAGSPSVVDQELPESAL